VVYLLKPGTDKADKVSPAAGESEQPAPHARREAAFYAIAKSWGIYDIPETHLLKLDHKEYACIKMLPSDWIGVSRARTQDKTIPRKILKPYLDTGVIYKWATLDYVLGQSDRHGNNLMTGAEGKIALIDHGTTFAGPSFNPAHDQYSFVPYYLRVWGPEKGWSKLSPEERFKTLPRLPEKLDDELADWINTLNEHDLSAICFAYGINPTSCLERLHKLKSTIPVRNSACLALNALWVL
jgi:hypothetical protein